eukprot:363345-Chlamydomonas_euryale.AAC.3
MTRPALRAPRRHTAAALAVACTTIRNGRCVQDTGSLCGRLGPVLLTQATLCRPEPRVQLTPEQMGYSLASGRAGIPPVPPDPRFPWTVSKAG